MDGRERTDGDHTGDVGAESSTVTAGVDGMVDRGRGPYGRRDRRPGVLGTACGAL